LSTYHQLTPGERYELSALRKQGYTKAEIARALGRHRSTIGREIQRNAREDGGYRASTAGERTRARRSRSRRNRRFTDDAWALVVRWLREDFSPEQVSGWLRRRGELWISHETIYRYIWADRRRGGTLYLHLRGARKQRRKRYGRNDSRGRLAGKRAISERPPGAANRSRVGHLEGDTVLGTDRSCILTLVDRKTGYTMIGKLKARTVEATNRAAIFLINRTERCTRSLTVDNGTEFHGYKHIEVATGAEFFFATPHHSWERGTNENTNGLIRQYAPKRTSLAHLTQAHCDRIAHKLNDRPRRRLGFRTPRECYEINSAT
jgi:IS30 family transposase